METKPYRLLAAAACALAGLSVAFGAFGAHTLADVLTADQQATFQTAVRYQFWHALALLVVTTSVEPSRQVLTAARLLLSGSILFSGSLYLLVIAHARWAGPITPIGGIVMIAGWVLLAWALWSRPS